MATQTSKKKRIKPQTRDLKPKADPRGGAAEFKPFLITKPIDKGSP
jgi:hypothetical protein